MYRLRSTTVLLRSLGVLATLVAAAPASALFFDGFESYSTGLAKTDFSSVWFVQAGGVDLIAQGSFGQNCAGFTGKCIDLGGSFGTGPGLFESADLGNLQAGETYVLTFEYSRNSNGNFGPEDFMTVSVGSEFSQLVTASGFPPYQTFSASFTASANDSAPTIVFDHLASGGLGGDAGILLDNVSLSGPGIIHPMPEAPAGAGVLGALLLAGIVGGWRGGRRGVRVRSF